MATVSERSESVVINVPSTDTLVSHRRFSGEIQEFANKQLILIADEQITVSTAITAQSKDLLFMGGVLKCDQEPDARWTIHVLVNRAMLVV
jgi:hypothetical protein